MNPGQATSPSASMVASAGPPASPTAVMRPPSMPMSALRPSAPVPSITVAPLITNSGIGPLPAVA